jgi:hypothetical protein
LASCCPARDIILTIAAKASGDRMLFVVILLEEALLSINGIRGRGRWPNHDGTRAGPCGRILEI